MTTENGVARGRRDAEGAFLRAALGDDLFCTSNGYMEIVSASGRKLATGDVKKALDAFAKLPESERLPGAVKVEPLADVDAERAAPDLPPGGLALRIFGRYLARGADGTLRHVTGADFPLMAGYDAKRLLSKGYLFEAHTDFFWLTESEWRSLVPREAQVGQRVQVPDTIVQRLCRHHLIPQRLYGEGGGWSTKGVRAAEMSAVVEEATPASLRLRIEGLAQLGSAYEADKATSPNGPLGTGFEPRFDGVVVYDRTRDAITRFDLVAAGDAWGRLGDANSKSIDVERAGRWPLAFALEVAGDAPVDRMTPTGRAERVRNHYFDGGK